MAWFREFAAWFNGRKGREETGKALKKLSWT